MSLGSPGPLGQLLRAGTSSRGLVTAGGRRTGNEERLVNEPQ